MNSIFEKVKRTDKGRAAQDHSSHVGTAEMDRTATQDGVEKRSPPMNSVVNEISKSIASASTDRPERRKQRRAGAKLLVRLRPADCKDPNFEEVLGTVNASRANLYVITASKCYYKRMPLRITFPYDKAHDSATLSEDTAEVVRLDHLADGRTGVAVMLQRPIHAPSQATVAPTGSQPKSKRHGERRRAVRHAVSASATVTEQISKARLEGRCSDLSVAGCYIDTLNPFPETTAVQVVLSNQQKNLEVSAKVISHHVGMGMGLVFDGPEPEQALVLVEWLSNRDATPEQSAATEPVAPPELSASSDRMLIFKLLRLLESNGKLTQAQISALLSEPTAL